MKPEDQYEDCVIVPGLGQCVVEIDKYYGTVFIDKDSFPHSANESMAEGDWPEINGNIYENPELLK